MNYLFTSLKSVLIYLSNDTIWYDKHDLMMENVTAPPNACTQYKTHGHKCILFHPV